MLGDKAQELRSATGTVRESTTTVLGGLSFVRSLFPPHVRTYALIAGITGRLLTVWKILCD